MWCSFRGLEDWGIGIGGVRGVMGEYFGGSLGFVLVEGERGSVGEV